MLAFINNFILFFAAESQDGGGFINFYNTYLNYPGFEAWKFLNLAIFIGILGYLLKKPLSDAFKAKRDAIRAELIRAEEEKQAALKQLTGAEAKLAALESETEALHKQAALEAQVEKERIARQAADEAERLRQQAAAELVRLNSITRLELRRFSAEESIKLAEEKIKNTINTEKDARLVKANIQSIGGLN